MTTELTTTNWSADQQLFMAWLATPKRERKPKTQIELAAEIGRNDSTLSEWKRLPGFADAVFGLAREAVKTDDLGEILKAQVRVAKSGEPHSTQAARFVFEATGVITKESKGGDTYNIDKAVLVRYVEGPA